MKTHKSMMGMVALVAVLVAPLAFAQSEVAPAASTDADADATATPPTPPPAAAAPTTSNDAAATPANPTRKRWADVDTDKDGKLSRTEASLVPALRQVFDQADADANGTLTADEYRAYMASSQDDAEDASQ